MLPSSLSDFTTPEGLVPIAGAGAGLVAGEYTGTLVQTLSNVGGYAGIAVKFIGEVVAGGILLSLSRYFAPGLGQTFLTLAGIAAPGAIVADLVVALSKKTATGYAQVSALSLRQMLFGGAPKYSRTLPSAGQSIYKQTLAGQVMFNKTLG